MKKILSVMFLLAVVTLSACSDDDNDNKAVVSDEVKTYILNNYPDAVIRNAEYEKGYLDVEIYHDARIKDVYFNSNKQWVATEWDIAITELPAAVTEAVKKNYPDYRIDDADYVITPEKELYYIEMERGNFEVAIYVTADGIILTK